MELEQEIKLCEYAFESKNTEILVTEDFSKIAKYLKQLKSFRNVIKNVCEDYEKNNSLALTESLIELRKLYNNFEGVSNVRYFILKKDCYGYKYDKRKLQILKDSDGNIKLYDKQIAKDLISNMNMHNVQYKYIAVSEERLSEYKSMIKNGDSKVFGV